MSRALAAIALMVFCAGGCAHGHLNASDQDLLPPSVQELLSSTIAWGSGPDDPQADAFFGVLAAELAAQMGDYDQASAYFLAAALIGEDPAVAERATRLALFAQNRPRARRAVERWLALDASALEANQISIVLTLDEGETQPAAQRLAQMLDQMDADDAHRVIVALLMQVDDTDAGLEALQQLRDLRPEQMAAWQAHAEFALRVDHFILARDVAREGLQHFPEATALRLTLAQALSELDDPAAALEALALAVEAHPERREVRLAYARALIELDDFETIRSEFDRLLALVPDDAQLRLTIGLLSLESSRLDIAEDYFLDLIQRGQRKQDAYYYLGRLYEQQGEDEKAFAAFGAVTQGERFDDARLRQARLAAGLEGLEAALARFADLQRDSDENLALRAYLNESSLLREQGEITLALQQLGRALIQFPGHLDLLYMRGLVHERGDDLAAAEADFRAILEVEPENASALNALGYTLADRTDRIEEAYGYIMRAYAQYPDDAAIVDSYGWVLYRLGRLDEALVQLRRAYDLFPDGEIASNLAVVLWELGHHDEARSIMAEALEREPEHERLIRVQQQLLHGDG